MKRKLLTCGGVLAGVLALMIILVWPMAPVWQRLGLPVFCIRGSFPNIQFIQCEDSQAGAPARALPTLSGEAPVPIIVDDDGSPDGVIALLFFLNNPNFDVKAVTVSCGEAHPQVFAKHLQQLLAGVGRPDIPVGVGRDTPLEGDNAFPDAWRQSSDEFWGVELPEGEITGEAVPAAELIAQTVAQSPQPVVVFVSGNHTNLAEALRLEPGIAGNIGAVQIMGGSLYVDGNIKSDWSSIDNSTAEWNIWVDPLAAKEVFDAGVTVHMTPLDATNQVMWRKADAATWAKASTPVGKLAGKMLDMLLRSWSSGGVFIWDLSAAINASDPALCAQSSLGVEVLTSPGPQEGRTVVTERTPNTVACLDPDAEKFKALAAAVFGR